MFSTSKLGESKMLLGETHYYEIFLLGLKWLSETDGEWDRPRSLSPILYTLKTVDLINEKQRRAAMRNQRLLDKLCRGIVVCHAEPGHRQDEVRSESVLHSQKHLVVVVQRGDGFKRKEVIARNGHRFVLTNSGRSLAEQKEGPYASIVTRERFLAGHAQMSERIVRVMSSINSHRTPRPMGDEEEFADIDFEEFLKSL